MMWQALRLNTVVASVFSKLGRIPISTQNDFEFDQKCHIWKKSMIKFDQNSQPRVKLRFMI